jgi:hypothetical protein
MTEKYLNQDGEIALPLDDPFYLEMLYNTNIQKQ